MENTGKLFNSQLVKATVLQLHRGLHVSKLLRSLELPARADECHVDILVGGACTAEIIGAVACVYF
jgi:hypothetical protein